MFKISDHDVFLLIPFFSSHCVDLSMESLSVHGLQQLGVGTTSSQQETDVVGRLVFGDDAKSTVLLQDVNTLCSIPCRTDRFYPILEGTLVGIRRWIYVKYSDQVDMLEFMLEDAYEVGVPGIPLSLKFDIQAQFASQALRPAACNFHTFDQLEQCPVDRLVSFAGMVAVKPATFCGRAMMQITNEHGDRSIYLAFADDKQYQIFDIGMYYLFMNVEFSVITDGQERHNVLKYSSSTSRAYAITKAKYDDLKYVDAESMQEDHDQKKLRSVVYTRSVESNNMSVYVGTVIRVVDAMVGIYELEGKTKDDRVFLCLFHYSDYRPMYPYRVGTKLKIHHTHIVALPNVRPSLLESWDAPISQHSNVETCLFLVGCLRTHVQLVSLPENSDSQYGSEWTHPQLLMAVYREVTKKRLDFATLMRCLDLYDSFSRKFECPQRAFISALKLAQLTHYERRVEFGDVYCDLLQHENGCSAIGNLDGTTVDLIQCLPLKAAAAKILEENKVHIDDKNFAAKTSHLEQLNVQVMQAEYAIDDNPNLWILGELWSSEEDGRLYLSDASGKIPLLIQDQSPENLPLGHLVLIRRMQLIQEDLSYKTEFCGKFDKYHTYITCKLQDILSARPPVREGKQIEERLTSADPLVIPDIVGFKSKNHRSNISVILILRVYPVILTHDLKTTDVEHDPFYYKASIRALRYPVNGSIHEMPTQVSISLDSRSKSLKFWSQLQPGYFYVIEGDLDNDQDRRIYNTFRKELKVPTDINVTLKLNADKHYLYPLVHVPDAVSSEQLFAITSSSAPQNFTQDLPEERKVYQVKDLYLPLQDMRSPMRTETEKSWMEKPIDLQGVIIAKKFREIHAARGTRYFRAGEALERHDAGAGEPGRGLFFRVRQIDGLDTVDIYMNISYRTWPLGLIPGSIVTFHNLFWKSIKNTDGFYCTVEVPTTWSVDVPSVERAEYILTTNITTRDLAQHTVANVESDENLLYKTSCWIQHIIQMELRWQCLECGSFIKNDQCENACSSAGRVFLAEAMARVEDDLGNAVAMFDGERLIMKLLGLTQRQADRLKETIRIRGPVFYGKWLDYEEQADSSDDDDDDDEGVKTMPKLTLKGACQRIERGRRIYNLYVRRIMFKRPPGQKHESLLEHGLRKATFKYKNGSSFDTLAYKTSRLKVLELEPVSTATHAWNYLEKITAKM